jgi:hypothetical protein
MEAPLSGAPPEVFCFLQQIAKYLEHFAALMLKRCSLVGEIIKFPN